MLALERDSLSPGPAPGRVTECRCILPWNVPAGGGGGGGGYDWQPEANIPSVRRPYKCLSETVKLPFSAATQARLYLSASVCVCVCVCVCLSVCLHKCVSVCVWRREREREREREGGRERVRERDRRSNSVFQTRS